MLQVPKTSMIYRICSLIYQNIPLFHNRIPYIILVDLLTAVYPI